MSELKIERTESPVFEFDEFGLHFVIYRHDFRCEFRPCTMIPYCEIVAYEEWDDISKTGIALGNIYFDLDKEMYSFVFGCFDTLNEDENDYLDHDVLKPQLKKLTNLYKSKYKRLYENWYLFDYGNIM